MTRAYETCCPVTSIRSSGAIMWGFSITWYIPSANQALSAVPVNPFRPEDGGPHRSHCGTESAQHGNGRFMSPQPFLKNHETKQHFVIVLLA